jgi:hypothetical protein
MIARTLRSFAGIRCLNYTLGKHENVNTGIIDIIIIDIIDIITLDHIVIVMHHCSGFMLLGQFTISPEG